MKIAIIVLLTFVIGGGVACQEKTIDKSDLKTQLDSVSYSFGKNFGNYLKTQKIDVKFDILIKGLKDGYEENEELLTDEEIQKTMKTFQEELFIKRNKEKKKLGGKNKAEGEAFLNENKNKKGVVTLPSGLQYKVLTSGDGPSPKATDKVTTHYTGKLIDGTIFDSSVERGQPATFGVNKVIKGWTEALQLMKVGDKWELYIPSGLAYGSGGAGGGKIGPDATLVFEIELIGIKN